MTTAETGSYPHDLAGDVTTPPAAASARAVQLARRARQSRLGQLEAAEPLGWTMPSWRLAGAIVQLVTEANEANPARDKSSDGTIGDARHAGGGPETSSWKASDHNPWVTVAGKGVVRAADIDVDGLDCPTAAERIRVAAAAGELPEVTHGGYVILNGKITAEDWSSWRQYKGPDSHVSHMHVSVSTVPAQFDAREPWGIFRGVDPAPTPPPTPPPPASWTGPDLTGRGPTLRGVRGANGPRVQALQHALAVTYPLYRHTLGDLAQDGWWGDVTQAWIAEFGHRSNIPEADGANIGPKLALALWRAGGLFRVV